MSTADIYTKRTISHDEAREIARRLINSHFRQEPSARVGIPARPDYDDDLLICAYIDQQKKFDAGISRRADGMIDRERAATRATLEAVMPDLTTAATDVLAERRRQVEVEGWDAAHDAKHGSGDLAAAGGCYALGAAFLLTPGLRYREYVPAEVPRLWPWDARWWKLNRRDPRRGLVKAGALILAEIERLDRAGAKETRG